MTKKEIESMIMNAPIMESNSRREFCVNGEGTYLPTGRLQISIEREKYNDFVEGFNSDLDYYTNFICNRCNVDELTITRVTKGSRFIIHIDFTLLKKVA